MGHAGEDTAWWLVEFCEKIDELMGRDFGLNEVAIGLMLDVSADFFALLKVGRNDDASMEAWRQALVAKRAEHFDASDGRHHKVEEDYVVFVGLGGGKALLAVADGIDLVACLYKGAVV